MSWHGFWLVMARMFAAGGYAGSGLRDGPRSPAPITWRRSALGRLRPVQPSKLWWSFAGILGASYETVPEQCSAGMFLFADASLFPHSWGSPLHGLFDRKASSFSSICTVSGYGALRSAHRMRPRRTRRYASGSPIISARCFS